MDLISRLKELENSANQQNPNKGTSGTNRQYDQNQGNRGKQLNPNHRQPTTQHFDDDDEGGMVFGDTGGDD